MPANLKQILPSERMQQRILFTLLMIFLYRLLAQLAVPGIDSELASSLMRVEVVNSSIFQLFTLFASPSFIKITPIALGLFPYVCASILMQFGKIFIPFLKNLSIEGQIGKKKLSFYTRILTLSIALFQAYLFAGRLFCLDREMAQIISHNLSTLSFFGLGSLLLIITFTAGSFLLVWIADQISEKGIGNGVTLLVAVNLLSSLLPTIYSLFSRFSWVNTGGDEIGPLTLLGVLVVLVFVFIATTLLMTAQRKVPVEYVQKRGIGAVAKQSSTLPLRVFSGGVLPLIFAAAICLFPLCIQKLGLPGSVFYKVLELFSPWHLFSVVLYLAFVFLFNRVYSAVEVNPVEIATNLKNVGGAVPGIKPGQPTVNYFATTTSYLSLIGGVGLILIALIPFLIERIFSIETVSHFFSGIALVILIGVFLDLSSQVNSAMLMEKYEKSTASRSK